MFLWWLVLLAAGSAGAGRIVSTAPNFTEILFAIGAGDAVVAVSDYCLYPDAAREKPRIGGPLNLHYERLLALRPDQVLLPASLEDAAAKSRALGLPVLQLPNESVEDVLVSISRLGDLTGRTSEAERLADRIAGRLESISSATRPLRPVRALIVVFRAAESLQDLTVAGRDTFLDELLRRAGGENVVPATRVRYPRLSHEELVAMDPEVIFDLTFTADREEAARVWRRLPSLAAVREGRVISLPDPSVTIPGPRMIDTLERFVEALHPEGR